MNINVCLAVGDLYIPGQVMREAIASLAPTQIIDIEWKAADPAELQARLLVIEQRGPDAVEPPPEIWELLGRAEFLMIHLCPVTKKMIESAPNLKYLGVCRGGLDSIDRAAVNQRRIQLFNAPGRNANAVAEMTVALMLAEARNIGRAHAALAGGGWRKDFRNEGKPGELRGKTVGLIGFGMIGRMVAGLLKGFGVQIVVYDPFVDQAAVAAAGAVKADLPQLLRRADFISLHARRGASEAPLLGQAEFAQMKPTAYLVNTARAALIDETALCEALGRDQIAGAALDVFRREPLPEDSPLRSLDNITLLPHLAGSTLEAWRCAPSMVVAAMLAQGKAS